MNTKVIAGTGIFLALTIVFTVVSNYVQIANISINLSLIPIVLAGILYGPIAGLVAGLVNGAFIMLAPSTAAFFAMSLPGTIIICLTKSAVAGVLASVTYKLLKTKYPFASVIIASVLAVFLNTAIFMALGLIFYNQYFSVFLSINFLIELLSTGIVVPLVAKALNKYMQHN